MRLSREITEEPQTTENKVCAGFAMRDSALLQQLPCNTGAPTVEQQTLRLNAKKAENPHTTESKTCAGLTARESVLVQQLP